MATFNGKRKVKPIVFDKFLGVNETVGESDIKKGEAVVQMNMRLTSNNKAQKREGHNTLIDFGNALDRVV